MRTRFLLAFRFAGTLLCAGAASVALAQAPTPAAEAAAEAGATAGAAADAGAAGASASAGGAGAAASAAAAPSVLDGLPDGPVPGPVLGEGIVIEGDGYAGGGASELFYNYYVPPVNGGAGAAMYPAPLPVPPHVGHVYYTYQPFYPHEYLYAHNRTYYRYHPGFEGYWYNGVYGHWPNYAGLGGNGFAGPDGFTPYTKTTVRWQTSRFANFNNRVFGKVHNFNAFDPSP
jgi:hypothetical protein